MRRYQLARAGQVIVSEIWAKRGAIGIVPADGDGSLVTSHFFLFDIDRRKALPTFLDTLFGTNWFEPQLDEMARGSTGYAAVRPAQFLSCNLPLPPMEEQANLAFAFTRASGTLSEVAKRRAHVVAGLHAMTAAVAIGPDSQPVSTSDLLTEPGLQNGKSVPEVGESFVRCLTLDAMRAGEIDPSKSKPVGLTPDEAGPFQVSAGDIFVMRGSGSHDRVGLAGRLPTNWVADPSITIIYPDLFIKVTLDSSKIEPDYFVTMWNSPHVRSQLSARTTSGQWKVSQRDIRAVAVPVPSRPAQIDAVRATATVRGQVRQALDLVHANEAMQAQYLAKLVHAHLVA